MSPDPERVVFASMTTRCELVARGRARRRLGGARTWVEAMAARLTRYDTRSEVGRFNAAAGAGFVAVSADLEALLRAALTAWEMSHGLVDASVLGASPNPLPDVLTVTRGRASLARGAAVDLGGLAKGWLADRLADRLDGDCIVNLGGDLFARGRWTIGFADAVIVLDGAGAATSGTARRGAHVIDPRTRRPAATDLAEVSVAARSGLEAEVFAKTALIVGRDAGAAWLRGRALAYSLR
jgi:thiamine biosynthesis lipoprotein